MIAASRTIVLRQLPVAELIIGSGALLGGVIDPSFLVVSALGLTLAAINRPGYSSIRLLIGSVAVTVASVALGLVLNLSWVATALVVFALISTPHEVLTTSGQKLGSTFRILAHAGLSGATLLGSSWLTVSVLLLGLAVVAGINEGPLALSDYGSVARTMVGASALPVGALAGFIAYSHGQGPSSYLLGAVGVVLGAGSTLVEFSTLRMTDHANTRRSLAFGSSTCCAEIDGKGKILRTNPAWTRQYFDMSGIDSFGADTWKVVSDSFLDVLLTGVAIHKELPVIVSGVRSGIRYVEIAPGDTESVTCLVSVRTELGRASRMEVAELREAIKTDALTGLLNRRGVTDDLSKRLETSPSWVMYFDLDGFKAVNDGLGHQVGDQVLIKVASRLTDFWRAEDSIGRIGGDEFVVVTSSEVSARRVQDCRSKLTFEMDGFEISTSIGHTRGDQGSDPDEVLDRADKIMYEAKKRNKQESLDRSQ